MKKFYDKPNCMGEYIHQYRLKKKLGVTDLCRELDLLGVNINRKDIYNMEKGTMIIKDFELLALTKVLEIPLENILKNIFK